MSYLCTAPQLYAWQSAYTRRRIKPSVRRWTWPLVNEFRLYWNHVKYNTISCFQLKSVCYLWQRHRQRCSWAGVILRKQTKNTCPQPFSKSAESHHWMVHCRAQGPGPQQSILSWLIVSQKLSLRMSEGETRSRIMSEGGTRSRTCSESSDIGEATGLLVILCFTTFVQNSNFSWQLPTGRGRRYGIFSKNEYFYRMNYQMIFLR